MSRFVNEYLSREHRFALGHDTKAGDPYLSIPVANRLVDYEEYYRLEPAMFDQFRWSEELAARFAEECRRHEHDDRLILQPGSDRGTAI